MYIFPEHYLFSLLEHNEKTACFLLLFKLVNFKSKQLIYFIVLNTNSMYIL